MFTTEAKVNTTLAIPFTDPELLEGKTNFTFTLVKDNEVYLDLATPPVLTEFGNGLYSMSINFNATGSFVVFIETEIRALVTVVEKLSNTILRDLDDAERGSYLYDKRTGTLTKYRTNGDVLDTYTVVDNNDQTSRELIS